MDVTEPISRTFYLPAGEALTVVADAVSTGIVFRLSNAAGDVGLGATAISASSTTVFGPFNVITRWNVVPTAGTLAVTQATATATQALDSLAGVAVDASGNVTAVSLTLTASPGVVFSSGQGFYSLTTAITANSTTTTAAAGSLAITSHATGVGKLFTSDGSKWQFVAVA
jgi:hypothetical protein